MVCVRARDGGAQPGWGSVGWDGMGWECWCRSQVHIHPIVKQTCAEFGVPYQNIPTLFVPFCPAATATMRSQARARAEKIAASSALATSAEQRSGGAVGEMVRVLFRYQAYWKMIAHLRALGSHDSHESWAKLM